MLELEEFKKYIEHLQLYEEFNRELRDLSKKYIDKDLLIDYLTIPCIIDSIELLTISMGLSKDNDILDYWVNELDFGKKYNKNNPPIVDYSLPKDNKFYMPDISTVDKLYEYIKFLVESNN